jgi:hypothetical protein
MGFWDKLLKTEQSIRTRVENAFGQGAAQTPLEIRREILEQVEARIVVDTGGHQFPYAKVIVQLQPATEALRDVFEAAFLRDSSLQSDILTKLKGSQARYPSNIEIVVELRAIPSAEQAESLPLFYLDFIKPDPSRLPELPEAQLIIIKGSATQPEYRLKKECILIGRLEELLDTEGRLLRRNDVVFLDSGEDVNATVGRAHAMISFDPVKREFFILDEGSRYGTRIVRGGRSIEVPGRNPRGIRLRSGDEIYCGQACLRYSVHAS